MSPHYSVMLREVLGALNPQAGEVYVDGTFGNGGYAQAILDAADCKVIAIDRDGNAAVRAAELSKKYGSRFIFLQGCFGDVAQLLKGANIGCVDGFVLDLGVSSMQLDQAERGFSFRFDGPLDMRMGSSEITAADIVNTYAQDDLANIIYLYGEERHSRRIAGKIVAMRAEKPFTRTLELADAVRSVVPKKPQDRIDPATRTFQALRIAVNDEMGELERALEAAVEILSVGGRLVVVSFHSLEDGMVKNFLKKKSEGLSRGSRYMPEIVQTPALFELLSRKAVKPSDKEIAENARSRSARLRAAVRTTFGMCEGVA